MAREDTTVAPAGEGIASRIYQRLELLDLAIEGLEQRLAAILAQPGLTDAPQDDPFQSEFSAVPRRLDAAIDRLQQLVARVEL